MKNSPKVNNFMAKNYENGTTKGFKKTPLILKEFFSRKTAMNYKSMTWKNKTHEDGLTTKKQAKACAPKLAINLNLMAVRG